MVLKDEVVVKAAAKPRPGRNAAKKAQPIVEVDSDEDGMDDDGSDE